ncbi:MAG: tRNA (adenosine(37)-N6)-threonylcarbamoyltransferase complex transferase subunit TsaD [Cytophagales bacterium]|nr:tRNA (adenosine(37)-N6)-threonylcarbamoyltransferase complex transferase subunit TsaD [Cytophagales bacterium]MDW8383804.1 tRNA (adenosine(37)-N6)-threonylcarbamoyltransferase complex transferase subunit TsaD [Flammeovirgaceae bacterium]
MKYPTILAIESSCDETSASVIQNGKILSNIIATQQVHQQWGGVVPELASREHQKNIVPVVDASLKQSKVQFSDLDAIAVTKGPGLLGSLLVGTTFAKGLSLALRVPLIAVNHMEAHVLAHFIEEPYPSFPFLCLTVSGGHTQIVLVEDYLQMKVIGQTQDDAVGEAFDKTAKLLGLPYPGGMLIDRLAQKGNPEAFQFPQVAVPNYDFSFSGIKTAILYFLQKNTSQNPNFVQENLADICASVQHTFVKMLISKLKRAAKELQIREIAIAGGVSANSELRKTVIQTGEKYNWNVYIPDLQYCTDNAAMVAIAAHYKYLAGLFADSTFSPDASLAIGQE